MENLKESDKYVVRETIPGYNTEYIIKENADPTSRVKDYYVEAVGQLDRANFETLKAAYEHIGIMKLKGWENENAPTFNAVYLSFLGVSAATIATLVGFALMIIGSQQVAYSVTIAGVLFQYALALFIYFRNKKNLKMPTENKPPFTANPVSTFFRACLLLATFVTVAGSFLPFLVELEHDLDLYCLVIVAGLGFQILSLALYNLSKKRHNSSS